VSKRSQTILISILFVYFAFTSGLVYWLMQYQNTYDLVIPFSWALSAEDTGLTGIATKDDLNCVQWLMNESDKNIKIVSDSNGTYLLSGYLELIPDVCIDAWGSDDRMVSIYGMYKCDSAYLFLTSWNTKHGKLIETSDVGMRKQLPFLLKDGVLAYLVNSELDGSQLVTKGEYVKEVYRSGDAVVLQTYKVDMK